MTALHDLRTDLVERKLWPVAAVLLAGSVAVPVAFAPGGSAAPAPPPAVAGAGSPSSGTTGLLADTAPSPGAPVAAAAKPKDPFVDVDASAAGQGAEAAAGLAGPGAVPGSATVDVVDQGTERPAPAAGADDRGTRRVVASSGSPSPMPGIDAAPQKSPRASQLTGSVSHTAAESPNRVGAGAQVPDRQPWAAQLRVGSRPLRAVTAMTPLPSADDPAVVYLGLLTHGRRAVLLLRDDVTAEGDGTCRPRPDNCQTLELGPGQHTRLGVDGVAGRLTIHYRGALAPRGIAATAASPHGRVAKPRLVSALTTGRTYWLDAHGGTLRIAGRVSRKVAAHARRRVAAAVAATGERRSMTPDLGPDPRPAGAAAVPLWTRPAAR